MRTLSQLQYCRLGGWKGQFGGTEERRALPEWVAKDCCDSNQKLLDYICILHAIAQVLLTGRIRVRMAWKAKAYPLDAGGFDVFMACTVTVMSGSRMEQIDMGRSAG